MLRNIDPILNRDILYVLASMGHGDEIVLVDMNFPADAVAQESIFGELVTIDAPTMARAVKAILSVMPLDSFVDTPARRMEIDGKADAWNDAMREAQAEIDAAEGRSWPMGTIERFRFYDEARKTYAVIRTGERRFYANVILKKGVVPPDA